MLLRQAMKSGLAAIALLLPLQALGDPTTDAPEARPSPSREEPVAENFASKKVFANPGDAARDRVDALHQLAKRDFAPAAPTAPALPAQPTPPAPRESLPAPAGPGKEDNSEAYARGLGFASAEEAAHAESSTPLRIYTVSLQQLKDFQPGDNPEAQGLLIDTHRVLFPLIIGGKVRSSLTASEIEQEKGWRVTREGSPKLSRLIPNNLSSSNFLVLISPLQLRFLGDRKAGELMLTPLENVEKYGLKLGQEQPAKRIFADIAEEAKGVYEKNNALREKVKQGRAHALEP